MTETELEALIEAHIEGARATARDTTGTRDHFAVEVVSTAFRGKSLVEQHKMVHAALGVHLTTTIHAIEIKTRTP